MDPSYHTHFFRRPSRSTTLTLVAGLVMCCFLFWYVSKYPWLTQWLVLGIGLSLTCLIGVYSHSVSTYQRYLTKRNISDSANPSLTSDTARSSDADQAFSALALQLGGRAIELSANAISLYDARYPDFPVCYVNPAFERMTGYRSSEIIGLPCCVLHVEEQETASTYQLQLLLEEKRAGNVALKNRKKDGASYWSELHIVPVEKSVGVVSYFMATQTDITSLKLYEDQLQHRAHYDSLTGLANRVLLRDRLNAALQGAPPDQHPLWVLFLGLDRFKLINESLGHHAGDHVLKILAARLNSCVSVLDTISRFAGDEFVVLLQAPQKTQFTMAIVEKIMSSIAQPIVMEEGNFFISCSIGISVFPENSSDADVLIHQADNAMHRAKEKGPNTFHFYTPQMNNLTHDRVRVEADLRSALERDEFVLHYQPQVDLRSGRMVGMEALIRWQHPELGRVFPVEFIALAEETGLIVPIGKWVIRTACLQAKAWHDQGFGNLRVSVNLSARQFSDAHLVGSIASVLTETGLAPACFELELTESLVMADVERCIGVLRDIKALGVRLAVDDFGTGYSSLAYLKRLPIDVLKIDRSFVSDITLDANDAVIVSSIISLAHSLHLSVVAEGVETSEQLSFLRIHGCDEIQGYHFSKPVSKADFALLLEQGKALPSCDAHKDIVSP